MRRKEEVARRWERLVDFVPLAKLSGCAMGGNKETAVQGLLVHCFVTWEIAHLPELVLIKY